MIERPLPFRGEQVRAILDGRMTQTRRIVKPPRNGSLIYNIDAARVDSGKYLHVPYRRRDEPDEGCTERLFPRWEKGDRLWVKETFAVMDRDAFDAKRPAPYSLRYKADPDTSNILAFRPAIHMPRWASRITLEITNVRVERLQDISDADARAEGVNRVAGTTEDDFAQTNTDAYRLLWESINGAGSWEKNYWVWVIEFKSPSHNFAKEGA